MRLLHLFFSAILAVLAVAQDWDYPRRGPLDGIGWGQRLRPGDYPTPAPWDLTKYGQRLRAFRPPLGERNDFFTAQGYGQRLRPSFYPPPPPTAMDLGRRLSGSQPPVGDGDTNFTFGARRLSSQDDDDFFIPEWLNDQRLRPNRLDRSNFGLSGGAPIPEKRSASKFGQRLRPDVFDPRDTPPNPRGRDAPKFGQRLRSDAFDRLDRSSFGLPGGAPVPENRSSPKFGQRLRPDVFDRVGNSNFGLGGR